VTESVLVRRLNLRVHGQRNPDGQNCLLGGSSDELERVNQSLLSGFTFIWGLARSEKHLIMTDTHAVAWPRRGIEAIARAAITHYERGHLCEGCEVFEAIHFSCTEHAAVFDDQQQEEWSLMDAMAPGVRERSVMTGVGAENVLGTATTLRHLSHACRRMRPAHEHAAQKMRWSRNLGFAADHASAAMRLGWAKVLEEAAAQRSSARCSNGPS